MQSNRIIQYINKSDKLLFDLIVLNKNDVANISFYVIS